MKKIKFLLGLLLLFSCNYMNNNVHEEQNITGLMLEDSISYIETDYSSYWFESESEESNKEIQKHLGYQSRLDTLDYKSVYDMTEKDIEIAADLLFKELINKGFKKINQDLFFDRVAFFFKVELNKESNCKLLQKFNAYQVYLLSEGDDELYLQETTYTFTYEHIFFHSNHGFISNVLYLGDIIDVEKKGESTIYLRDDIFHRNKYIFNGSEASLTWLILNDFDFIKNLVKVFGYDKDVHINKAVVQDIYEIFSNSRINPDRKVPNNFFATKNCKGVLEIREGLLQYIVNTTTLEQTDLLQMLKSYCKLISNEDSLFDKFTRSERIKILAYVGYYIELAYLKNEVYTYREGFGHGSFFRNEFTRNDELLASLEENNYYDLPNFREITENLLERIEEENAHALRQLEYRKSQQEN